MKERGKAIKTYRNFPVFNCSASDTPCNKHQHSSHVGICPYCLTDKLMELVCSECGKSRVSSCSCSDSNRTSRNLFDVGRFSFLIENERNNEKVVFFRRSSSSCVGVKKKKGGFWRIKGLFGKKRNTNGGDDEVEVCVSDINRLSRSVSFSNAKISGGLFFDSNQMDKDRACNFQNRSVFPIKGGDISPMDDADFIDLKLDSLSKSNQDFFCSGVSDHANMCKNGNSEIASVKTKWGLWKKGFLQGSKKY
ncbi:hypothetical protein ACS0TY_008245 [Phlomoides rotata]